MPLRFDSLLLSVALAGLVPSAGVAVQDAPASQPAASQPAASQPAASAKPGTRGASLIFSKDERAKLTKLVREYLETQEKLTEAKREGDVMKIKPADSKAKKAETAVNAELKKLAQKYKLGADKQLDAQCLTAVADWQAMLSEHVTAQRDYQQSGKSFGVVKESLTREGKFAYAEYVPKRYDVKSSWPLLLMVQDRGKQAKQALADVLKHPSLLDGEGAPSGTIVLVTALPEGDDAQALLRSVILPLKEARQVYRIDPNRIAIGGIGEGAAAAASVATHAPHWFSAFVAIGGAPGAAKPINFTNIPVLLLGATEGWAEWAKNASAAGVNVRSMEGAGGEALAPWLAERVRNPYPSRIAFSPSAERRRAGYWLSAEPDPGKETRIDATIDGNVVRVDADGITSYRLLLSDALVDLTKPVRIVTNGESPWEGKLPPSMPTLLRSLEDAGGFDPGAVYTVAHQVSVRSKRGTAADRKEAGATGSNGADEKPQKPK